MMSFILGEKPLGSGTACMRYPWGPWLYEDAIFGGRADESKGMK